MNPSRPRLASAGLAVVLGLGLLAGCQAPVATQQAPAPVTAPPSAATPTLAPTSAVPPAGGKVVAGELRRLSVPKVGFEQAVFPLATTAMGNAIDPPKYAPGKPSLPVRVSDKGVQPASDAEDTVYVGCHTSARNGAEMYPCNVLIRKVAAGDEIVATTDGGTLTYTVTKTRSIPYDDFAGDDETWRIQGKRLVFVVCDVVDGKANHANWVIYAETK